jgi:hypothetical protein
MLDKFVVTAPRDNGGSNLDSIGIYISVGGFGGNSVVGVLSDNRSYTRQVANVRDAERIRRILLKTNGSVRFEPAVLAVLFRIEPKGTSEAPNSTGHNNTSAWELGVQWLTGTGPRVQNFGDGDPLTVTLQQHSHIQDTRDLVANNIANGGKLEGDNNYALGGLQGVPKYIKDYSTLATGGLTGNLAVTYLGSYSLHYEVTGINLENQTATVNFHVTNDSTINSATHPPVIGYTQTWNTYIGQPLNNAFATGPMSKTTQNFNWTETIKWPPGG